jgi:hypothetical protein
MRGSNLGSEDWGKV